MGDGVDLDKDLRCEELGDDRRPCRVAVREDSPPRRPLPAEARRDFSTGPSSSPRCLVQGRLSWMRRVSLSLPVDALG